MASQNPHIMKWGLRLLLLSAPCWWIGAFGFLRVVGAVYDAQDSAAQLSIIGNHPIAWQGQNLCFLCGVLATCGGLVTLTAMLHETWARRFAVGGLVTTLIATVLGIGVVYRALNAHAWLMATSPPMYSGAGTNPLHTMFGVLTLVGFIGYGLALVSLQPLRWTGVVAIVLSTGMLVQVAQRHDAFPPLFFYTVPFMFGVRLLFRHAGGERIGAAHVREGAV